MPQIPEWAANQALTIFYSSTFEAQVLIGQQQVLNGTPLKPGAPKRAVDQLLQAEKLVTDQRGTIDINPFPAKTV